MFKNELCFVLLKYLPLRFYTNITQVNDKFHEFFGILRSMLNIMCRQFDDIGLKDILNEQKSY